MKTTMKIDEKSDLASEVENLEFEEMEQGVSQAGMGFMMAMAGLIGFWGLACLASAVAQNGVLALFRGWLSAVGI
ncbi:MAG: hypothetical protein M0017_07110 [Desulfobacteraceae bacterium]|nr:hypothetical protein [Desulfobacteraceae bacterium]